MRRLLAPIFLLVLFATPAFRAAAEPLLPPRSDGLYSNVLHQQRAIDIYLPEESAADPAARYETLYVLDGDWNAKLVADIVTFMRKVGFLPPLIVVGVSNHFDADGTNSRDHDLTPTSSPDQARSGGAAQFLAFLKTELIPYVEAHYPANGVRSIHGHSYGGLFLFYVLMNDPSLFGGYLVLDPAMGWDKHMFDAIGTVVKGKPLSLHRNNIGEQLDVRYTTDGSEPGPSSPKLGELARIDDAAKTRIKLLSNRGVFDRELPHHLVDGKPMRPSSRSTAARDARWHFALYPIEAWPDLHRAKPLRTEDARSVNDLPVPDRDAFAASATRDFVVDNDGYYVFYVESSDKARLTVAGKVVADVDGTKDGRVQAIVEPLQRGTYELKFEVRHPEKTTRIDPA